MNSSPTLTCRTERRRDAVRKKHLNGIDYVEVIDAHDQRELSVYFLGKVPPDLTAANVVIEGGRSIRGIKVKSALPQQAAEEDRDDSLRVTVDRAGDFSTYTLRLVVAKEGRPTKVPLADFDARYSSAKFSFKAGCPSDLDCQPAPLAPPAERAEPDIHYLAKDYASFRQLILDRLALIMPEWQERHVPDLGITLVELLAYVGDYLSYYQDAVGTEAYLDTARRRISVRRHARLVGYTLHEGCNARAWVCLETSETHTRLKVAETRFAAGLSRPQITRQELDCLPSGGYEIFEPLLPDGTEFLEVYHDHHAIDIYTWGDADCCLPRGTTSATLVGELVVENSPPPKTTGKSQRKKLHLKEQDVLIFEEVKSPRTGEAADADPAKRWAVRLTSVQKGEDTLDGTPVIEIAWAREDALPFCLCLSARLEAPDCRSIRGLSVARANVVLVDHGASVHEGGNLDPVPGTEAPGECACEGSVLERTRVPGRFAPTLRFAPLTFSVPLAKKVPAALALAQDPRAALPRMRPLIGLPDVWPARAGAPFPEPQKVAKPEASMWQWKPQPDLLGSGKGDRHFVVEIDNECRAHLRFGDGECGRQPAAGTIFQAPWYRIGNGPAGNVGAGAISTVVQETIAQGATLTVRNPLAARGGTAPEPIAEAKLFAPHAFRHGLQRAITAGDYARLAERQAAIQRAGAALRWTGSWYAAQVAIDPLDSEEPGRDLLRRIERGLRRYRRIGHDLEVRHARYVPLEIALDVCVQPHFQRGHVEGALRDVFSNRRLAGGKLGYFHPDRLTFGTSIYLSQLVAVAQAVTGVASVQVTVLQRLGQPANDELATGMLSLDPLEIAQFDNDPSFPDRGKLTLNLKGGR